MSHGTGLLVLLLAALAQQSVIGAPSASASVSQSQPTPAPTPARPPAARPVPKPPPPRPPQPPPPPLPPRLPPNVLPHTGVAASRPKTSPPGSTAADSANAITPAPPQPLSVSGSGSTHYTSGSPGAADTRAGDASENRAVASPNAAGKGDSMAAKARQPSDLGVREAALVQAGSGTASGPSPHFETSSDLAAEELAMAAADAAAAAAELSVGLFSDSIPSRTTNDAIAFGNPEAPQRGDAEAAQGVSSRSMSNGSVAQADGVAAKPNASLTDENEPDLASLTKSSAEPPPPTVSLDGQHGGVPSAILPVAAAAPEAHQHTAAANDAAKAFMSIEANGSDVLATPLLEEVAHTLNITHGRAVVSSSSVSGGGDAADNAGPTAGLSQAAVATERKREGIATEATIQQTESEATHPLDPHAADLYEDLDAVEALLHDEVQSSSSVQSQTKADILEGEYKSAKTNAMQSDYAASVASGAAAMKPLPNPKESMPPDATGTSSPSLSPALPSQLPPPRRRDAEDVLEQSTSAVPAQNSAGTSPTSSASATGPEPGFERTKTTAPMENGVPINLDPQSKRTATPLPKGEASPSSVEPMAAGASPIIPTWASQQDSMPSPPPVLPSPSGAQPAVASASPISPIAAVRVLSSTSTDPVLASPSGDQPMGAGALPVIPTSSQKGNPPSTTPVLPSPPGAQLELNGSSSASSAAMLQKDSSASMASLASPSSAQPVAAGATPTTLPHEESSTFASPVVALPGGARPGAVSSEPATPGALSQEGSISTSPGPASRSGVQPLAIEVSPVSSVTPQKESSTSASPMLAIPSGAQPLAVDVPPPAMPYNEGSTSASPMLAIPSGAQPLAVDVPPPAMPYNEGSTSASPMLAIPSGAQPLAVDVPPPAMPYDEGSTSASPMLASPTGAQPAAMGGLSATQAAMRQQGSSASATLVPGSSSTPTLEGSRHSPEQTSASPTSTPPLTVADLDVSGGAVTKDVEADAAEESTSAPASGTLAEADVPAAPPGPSFSERAQAAIGPLLSVACGSFFFAVDTARLAVGNLLEVLSLSPRHGGNNHDGAGSPWLNDAHALLPIAAIAAMLILTRSPSMQPFAAAAIAPALIVPTGAARRMCAGIILVTQDPAGSDRKDVTEGCGEGAGFEAWATEAASDALSGLLGCPRAEPRLAHIARCLATFLALGLYCGGAPARRRAREANALLAIFATFALVDDGILGSLGGLVDHLASDSKVIGIFPSSDGIVSLGSPATACRRPLQSDSAGSLSLLGACVVFLLALLRRGWHLSASACMGALGRSSPQLIPFLSLPFLHLIGTYCFYASDVGQLKRQADGMSGREVDKGVLSQGSVGSNGLAALGLRRRVPHGGGQGDDSGGGDGKPQPTTHNEHELPGSPRAAGADAVSRFSPIRLVLLLLILCTAPLVPAAAPFAASALLGTTEQPHRELAFGAVRAMAVEAVSLSKGLAVHAAHGFSESTSLITTGDNVGARSGAAATNCALGTVPASFSIWVMLGSSSSTSLAWAAPAAAIVLVLMAPSALRTLRRPSADALPAGMALHAILSLLLLPGCPNALLASLVAATSGVGALGGKPQARVLLLLLSRRLATAAAAAAATSAAIAARKIDDVLSTRGPQLPVALEAVTASLLLFVVLRALAPLVARRPPVGGSRHSPLLTPLWAGILALAASTAGYASGGHTLVASILLPVARAAMGSWSTDAASDKASALVARLAPTAGSPGGTSSLLGAVATLSVACLSALVLGLAYSRADDDDYDPVESVHGFPNATAVAEAAEAARLVKTVDILRTQLRESEAALAAAQHEVSQLQSARVLSPGLPGAMDNDTSSLIGARVPDVPPIMIPPASTCASAFSPRGLQGVGSPAAVKSRAGTYKRVPQSPRPEYDESDLVAAAAAADNASNSQLPFYQAASPKMNPTSPGCQAASPKTHNSSPDTQAPSASPRWSPQHQVAPCGDRPPSLAIPAAALTCGSSVSPGADTSPRTPGIEKRSGPPPTPLRCDLDAYGGSTVPVDGAGSTDEVVHSGPYASPPAPRSFVRQDTPIMSKVPLHNHPRQPGPSADASAGSHLTARTSSPYCAESRPVGGLYPASNKSAGPAEASLCLAPPSGTAPTYGTDAPHVGTPVWRRGESNAVTAMRLGPLVTKALRAQDGAPPATAAAPSAAGAGRSLTPRSARRVLESVVQFPPPSDGDSSRASPRRSARASPRRQYAQMPL